MSQEENRGQEPRRKKRRAENPPPQPEGDASPDPPAEVEPDQEPEPESRAVVRAAPDPEDSESDAPEPADAPEAPEPATPMDEVKQTMAMIHNSLVEHGFRPRDAEDLLNTYAKLHALWTALVKRHDSNEKLILKTEESREEHEDMVRKILRLEED